MQAGDNRAIVLQLTDIVPLVRKYFSMLIIKFSEKDIFNEEMGEELKAVNQQNCT